MTFFQNSVLSKYLKTQDPDAVKAAYATFTARFHNSEVQENIRNSKEEQYQGEFLIDLFVNVLGYTKNPAPAFNLTTEYKNVKDNKKADGAIILNWANGPRVVAVIELKGIDTTDLGRIETQAFGYKNNQPDCVYVITSNFEKLRFYIDNAIDNIEFNLFTLTFKEFELLWLCLAFENIERNLPKRIKDESVSQEDVITKNLYNDYSRFKRELHQNLVALNPQYDALTLFRKSQKLLDRFLFLFFAEDRQLLPPNSVRLILDDWRDLQDRDVQIPLYDRFKKYFEYLNTGFKGKRYEVFAYNGGLFRHDELLDALKMNDELLYRHTMKLSEYDFNSEVDVNILGHIFENSLNELDEIKAQLEGQPVDKAKSKRKRDGVFYTPKYITKYIVDNTVGKLCTEKKEALGLAEEDYTTDRKRTKKALQPLNEKLNVYRDWLLQLTICDPACGSGAFLNQALDFLISEHRLIDELQAKLFGSSLVLGDFENSILENNLFGVDINEESVEIAKLSLWLRTAQPNRKLNDLNHNLKCGNSLIDDPAVAGDKAFNWQQEFPDVFARGGFDVVIGNPPYVRQELLGDYKDYFSKNYMVFNYSSDLFAFFYEKGFTILKPGMAFGFISNTFEKTTAGIDLRAYLTNQKRLVEYVDFTEVQIFEGATTYPVIIIALNNYTENNYFQYIKIPRNTSTFGIDIKFHLPVSVVQQSLEISNWSFNSTDSNALLSKISKHKTIRDQYSKCYYGIKTGFNEAFIISRKERNSILSESPTDEEIIKPFYEGKDILKWNSLDIDKYILFTRRGIDIENYPGVKNWLSKYKSKLEPRNNSEQVEGRKPGPYRWYEIQDSVEYYKLFENHKITWANLQNSNKFCFEDKGYYINAPSVIFPTNEKSLLPILNSNLVWYFLTSICVMRSGGYIEVKPQYFEKIPIPEISEDGKRSLLEKADLMISLSNQFQELSQKFQRTLQRKFNLSELPGKLQNWYLLSYAEFIKELAKKKVKLSLSEEAEWEAYFLQEAQQALAIKAEIVKTDKEIDRMVYELYGLTEEEIEIVEEKG
jgi:type I restriction-modification system DNA methylase subunit